MTSQLERIARTTWHVQVAHRHTDPCPNDDDWHTQMVEAWTPPGTDHYMLGDVWWPKVHPTAWLLDWHAHPSTTALVVVTNGTMRSASWDLPVHLVACVARDGRSVALLSPDDDPPSGTTRLQGALYAAMLQAMSPVDDDPLTQELAVISSEGPGRRG